MTILASALAGLVLCAGCASPTSVPAEPATVPAHASADEAVRTLSPDRVAVLDVVGLDTLDALGFGVAIVPAPPSGESAMRWPRRLIEKYSQDRYVKLAGVGRAREEGQAAGNPQLDSLKAARPDLVVIGGRGRGGGTDAVADVAPVVTLSTSNASFVDSVVRNILALGAAFGQQDRAVAKVQSLLANVGKLRETAATQGTGLVMFAVGDRVMPQQLDARFGLIYDIVGIRPALAPTDGAGGLGSGRPPARAEVDENDPAAKAAAEAAQKARQAAEAKYLEDALAHAPDWIFVVDRNAAFGEAVAAQAMAATPAVANSRAWREGKVIYLDHDGGNWYTGAGGLGLLEDTIARIQAAFDQHPATR